VQLLEACQHRHSLEKQHLRIATTAIAMVLLLGLASRISTNKAVQVQNLDSSITITTMHLKLQVIILTSKMLAAAIETTES